VGERVINVEAFAGCGFDVGAGRGGVPELRFQFNSGAGNRNGVHLPWRFTFL
jgi:hypothetical protein